MASIIEEISVSTNNRGNLLLAVMYTDYESHNQLLKNNYNRRVINCRNTLHEYCYFRICDSKDIDILRGDSNETSQREVFLDGFGIAC